MSESPGGVVGDESPARFPERRSADPGASEKAREPRDAVIGWLTDFDDPAVGAVRERRLDRRFVPSGFVPRTRVPWSAVLALVAGIGAAIAAIATVEPKFDPVPGAVSSPTSTSSPPPPTIPEPTITLPPATETSRLPDSCGEFFGWRMESKLADKGLKLYTPDSLAEASLSVPQWWAAGTADTRLSRMLAGVGEMDCYWMQGDDQRTTGILTVVGEGRATQLAVARERLEKLGLTRIDEEGGIRYFEETVGPDGAPRGESHFFRGGVWFATSWYGYGPRGYSVDMAEHVFSDR